LCGAADTLDDTIKNLAMHVQTRARRAHLARIEEDGAGRAADDGVDIGVRQDDDGRLAAELERNALQRIRRSFVDGFADERRARERDLVDAGMRHERCADRLAVARQDVDDAGRKARFDDEIAKLERRERCLLRRFQDAGAARC
jgi:hypothetical protein